MTTEQIERNKALVEALRSGEYKQAKGRLRRDDAFCCLGVAADLSAKAGVGDWSDEDMDTFVVRLPNGYIDRDRSVVPAEVQAWYGWPDCNPKLRTSEEGLLIIEQASVLNDEYGWTFNQIADAFEQTFLGREEDEDGSE